MFSWKNERVLVTGASGFVGSHLVKTLRERGADVTAVSSRSGTGRGGVKCDVRDMKALGELFRKKRITMCYHLAGLSQVEAGQASPHPTFETNVLGALNMLECSRIFHVRRVIVASTAHVYGRNPVPYRETYTPKPSRPYETSKACIDLMAMSYADTYRMPVYIARFVNIYGPGDLNFSRLIPKTIRSVLSGAGPDVWGGKALRDYLYIDDAVSAYVLLGEATEEKLGSKNIFNFGTSKLLSVLDIIERIIRLSGKPAAIRRIADLRENEIPVQYVSWARARKLLGWRPKTDIDTGMKRTVGWYASYFAGTP